MSKPNNLASLSGFVLGQVHKEMNTRRVAGCGSALPVLVVLDGAGMAFNFHCDFFLSLALAGGERVSANENCSGERFG